MKQETKQDIKIMILQFIGAFIVFFLVFNSNHQWITGKIVIIGNIIYYSFMGLGIILPIIFIFIVSTIILKEKKNGKKFNI